MTADIVAALKTVHDPEIPSERIGELVMEGLAALDSVSYVRFASVYKDFREAKDFEEFIGELSSSVSN